MFGVLCTESRGAGQQSGSIYLIRPSPIVQGTPNTNIALTLLSVLVEVLPVLAHAEVSQELVRLPAAVDQDQDITNGEQTVLVAFFASFCHRLPDLVDDSLLKGRLANVCSGDGLAEKVAVEGHDYFA